MKRRKREPRQAEFDLQPPPMIRGATTMRGRDLWYNWRTCCWDDRPSADCIKPRRVA